MRAAVLGLPSLFDKQAQTQRRNGRELISLLHYHLSVITNLKVRGFMLLGRRRRKPSEEGERERMSLLPLSQPIGRVWLRAGFEKREYQIQRRRGENMCRVLYLNHPRRFASQKRSSGNVDIRCRACKPRFRFFLFTGTNPAWGRENSS